MKGYKLRIQGFSRSGKGMGEKNSSLTRVQPIFQAIENAGKNAAELLLECAHSGNTFIEKLKVLDQNIIDRGAEKKLPPPGEFLRWLVQNPLEMTWPTDRNKVDLVYGEDTQQKREKLIRSQDESVKQEAIKYLYASVLSERKWYIFEGPTYIDYFIETNSTVFVIEGKRTEKLASSTDWYPARNQLFRNLEVAQEYARKQGKEFVVFVAAESEDIGIV